MFSHEIMSLYTKAKHFTFQLKLLRSFPSPETLDYLSNLNNAYLSEDCDLIAYIILTFGSQFTVKLIVNEVIYFSGVY